MKRPKRDFVTASATAVALVASASAYLTVFALPADTSIGEKILINVLVALGVVGGLLWSYFHYWR